MSVRKWLKGLRIWDFLTIAALIYLVTIKGPVWLKQWQTEGEPVPSFRLEQLDGQPSIFPKQDSKGWILVFWATWCGPCHVEMERLQAAASEGKIDPKRIIALSSGETPDELMKSIRERVYPFEFLLDSQGEAAQHFEVRGTPTIVFLDPDLTVSWITTGLSPTLIWRAERHLAQATL